MRETEKKRDSFIGPALRAVAVCALVFVWLWAEQVSDTLLFTRYAAAAVGIAAACLNFFFAIKTRRERGGKRRAADRRAAALTGVFSVLFGLAVPLADYRNYAPLTAGTAGRAVLCLLCGSVMAWEVLTAFQTVIRQKKERRHRARGGWVFAAAFLILAAVYLIHLYGAAYPGYLTRDSVIQVEQVLTGSYSNHHPYWHTMLIRLCISIGTALFHDINRAVALYSLMQALGLAAAFAYLIMTLYESGMPLVVPVLALAGYAALPYHIYYSVTMWKDIPFALCGTVLITALYRLVAEMGSRRLSLFLIGAAGIGFGVFRSNGWLALLITGIAVAAVLKKRGWKLAAVIAVSLLVAFVLKHPVLKWLDVPQPALTESLSIPVQQIARVICDGELTDEEREELDHYMAVDGVPNNYKPWISDPMKNNLKKFGLPYLEEHKGDFIRLWAKIGLHNPKLYVEAWVDQTKGYWTLGYDYWIWLTSIDENSSGVAPGSDVPLKERFIKYGESFHDSDMCQPLRSIGLCIWLIAAAFIAGCAARRRETLLAVPIAAVVLTLLIATPVYCEFRYIYLAFAAFPLIMAAILFPTDCPAS